MTVTYPEVGCRNLTPCGAGLNPTGHFGYVRPSADHLCGEAVSLLKQQPHGGRFFVADLTPGVADPTDHRTPHGWWARLVT